MIPKQPSQDERPEEAQSPESTPRREVQESRGQERAPRREGGQRPQATPREGRRGGGSTPEDKARRQEQAEQLIEGLDYLKSLAVDVVRFLWGGITLIGRLLVIIIRLILQGLLFIYGRIIEPAVVTLGTPIVNYLLAPLGGLIARPFLWLGRVLWQYVFRYVYMWMRAGDQTFPMAKYLLVLALFVYYNFTGQNSILDTIALKGRIAQQNRTIDSLRRAITQDSLRIRSLTEPEGVERIARERYYMHAPGEEVYIIVPELKKPFAKPTDSLDLNLTEAPVDIPAVDPADAPQGAR